MKKTRRLRMRVPGWAELENVVCRVDGERVEVSFEGRYAVFGEVKAGSTATIEFPISINRVRTFIGGKPFTVWIKGADVIDIAPRGRWGGYYKRDKYREDQVRWVERERFIADKLPPQDY